MPDKIKIRNVHNGQESEIHAGLWAKKRGQYQGVFVEVQPARVPPEVKELKKKQAEQSQPEQPQEDGLQDETLTDS